ncbi:ABC transporter substrate-binding protein [Haloferacaceae archaeon DSL9]
MVYGTSRRRFVKGAAIAGSIGLAGCLSDENTGDDGGANDTGGDGGGNGAGGSVDEVLYGILVPDTGDLGSLGGPIGDGAELPARQLADEGFDNISYQRGDSQTDPQAGISEANSLVNGGVPAVVGPAASNVNLQVAEQVYIPQQVVGISPASTSPAVTDLDDDGFIFRTCPSDALQGPVMSQVAVDTVGAQTAGTLYLNDDYGQALEREFAASFEEAGGTVQNQVSFEPEQPNYTSQIGDALADDPDVLMVVGFPQSGIQLFRDYYSNFDTGVDILVPDGLLDEDLPTEVGNDMENVRATAPSSAGPGNDFFTQQYEDTFGTSPAVFNGQAYDAAAVIILATFAAGEASGPAIRDQIPNVANPEGEEITPETLADGIELAENGDEINYQGASSTVDFDENGDIVAAVYDIYQYTGGGVEVTDSVDFSEEDA